MSGPLVQALEKRRQEDLAKTQPLTPGTLEWAWAQAQKPFKGYWDRQGLMAREGLAMADQGAQQVQQGDLSGLAGLVLGPANYLSSPINALFPIEEAQTQLPKEVSPFVAGGLELMALAAPGPKGGKVRKVADAAEEGITAYHGSPHTFDKFDMSKIGTGEGAQAYGHGLYFAENEAVSKGYRDTLSKETLRTANGDVFDPQSLEHLSVRVAANRNGTDLDATIARAKEVLASANDQTRPMAERDLAKLSQLKAVGGVSPNPGSMYQVRLNVKPDELLDWDARLADQPGYGKITAYADQAKELGLGKEYRDFIDAAQMRGMTGEDFMTVSGGRRGARAIEVANDLKAAGIKGIRYKDAGSRDKDGGTYNYVIFDDKLVDILKRYAIPFTLGAGGAAIVSGQDMPPEVASQLGPQA